MGWYDADLGQNGVQRLNDLFDKSPYDVKKSERATHTTASINVAGERTDIFIYDREKLVVFHEALEGLSKEVVADVLDKLQTVESLQEIVGTFSDRYQ
jgi:hypothetical protein